MKTKKYIISRNVLLNIVYFGIGLMLTYISATSLLPIADDEIYYLTVAELPSSKEVLAASQADSLNFLWPLILSILGPDNYDNYYRYLGSIIYISTLWLYVGKNNFVRLLTFIFSLPVFWYFGTYLRDGFIFACSLYLLSLTRGLMLNENRLSIINLILLIMLLAILSGLRFYYAIPFFIIILTIGAFKSGSVKWFYILISIAIVFVLEETIVYAINTASKIDIKVIDFMRIILNPIPTDTFGQEIERYESSALYNITFIIRVINLAIVLPVLLISLIKRKISKEFIPELVFLICITITTVATGNVGPRQSFIIGLIILTVFLKAKNWKIS